MPVVGDNGTGSRVEMQWGLTGSRAGYLFGGQVCPAVRHSPGNWGGDAPSSRYRISKAAPTSPNQFARFPCDSDSPATS